MEGPLKLLKESKQVYQDIIEDSESVPPSYHTYLWLYDSLIREFEGVIKRRKELRKAIKNRNNAKK